MRCGGFSSNNSRKKKLRKVKRRAEDVFCSSVLNEMPGVIIKSDCRDVAVCRKYLVAQEMDCLHSSQESDKSLRKGTRSAK